MYTPGINAAFLYLHKNILISHTPYKSAEATVLQLVNWLYKETQEENLCMAGGVALNCVINAVIRDKGPFKNIWYSLQQAMLALR